MRPRTGLAALILALWAAAPLGAEPTFPLRVDAASRRLVGANDEPFFIAGDAGWSLIVQRTRDRPVLLGARGHVSGNRPMWLYPGWPTALSSAGTNLVRHFSALFRSREGWGLVPDISGTIVVSRAGNPSCAWDFAPAARTASNSSVLVYVPANRTVGIDTSKVPGTQYSGDFYTLRPCRLYDSRSAGGALSAGSGRNGTVAGRCGVPATVWAVALNVTATAANAPGHLRLYAAGSSLPTVSTVDYASGQTRETTPSSSSAPGARFRSAVGRPPVRRTSWST
jgi:hypothetical protein